MSKATKQSKTAFASTYKKKNLMARGLKMNTFVLSYLASKFRMTINADEINVNVTRRRFGSLEKLITAAPASTALHSLLSQS